MPETIVNFGRNVSFTPAEIRAPRSEDEIRDLLRTHRDALVRVTGSRHGWSEGVVTGDVLVNMEHFDSVRIDRDAAGGPLVTVGGGCRIDALLAALRSEGLTLPTIGTITRQTVAGAISTGTHGSGRSSLSHYVQAMRVAAYDTSGAPVIRDWTDENDLQVLRCGVGCTGIIVSVTFRCVPVYAVVERVVMHDSIEAILSSEPEYPLQEFALVPFYWRYVGYHRTVMETRTPATSWLKVQWYRFYKLALIDVGFHLLLKVILALHALGAWLSRASDAVTVLFYQTTPLLVGPAIWTTRRNGVADDSEAALTRRHYLFRHVEMEIFIPEDRIVEAAELLRAIVNAFAGRRGPLPERARAQLAAISIDGGRTLLDELERHRGTYLHHYPLYFRRVMPDRTLISMTGGATQPYYAIGLFCYRSDKRTYYAFARFVATAVMRAYDARLHWGKYLPTFPERPVTSTDLEALYPRLSAFRDWCLVTDPAGTFRNRYTHTVLGFQSRKWPVCRDAVMQYADVQ